MKKKLVSIIISAYNEEENIPLLYDELAKTAKLLTDKVTLEYVFVNDGSSDGTLQKCVELQKKDPQIKIVNLLLNFGHEIAMTAGMDCVSGDAAIFMDADLQHPPEYLIAMIDAWLDGSEIVLTRRIGNEDNGLVYSFLSRIFYALLNLISRTEIPKNMPDFRLLDRKYIDFLKQFDERDRLFRGLLGIVVPLKKCKTIDFVAPKRQKGHSKYHFFKSMGLAFNSIVQFSIQPLRISLYLGIIAAIFAIGLGIFVAVEHFVLERPSTGYATTMCAITLLGAVQLIILGIIGEYIGKIHMEVKKRPLYFADYIGETDNARAKNSDSDL